jgi:hypothetical protein
MKKLILTAALAAAFMTVQAQDDAKSVSEENKTEQPTLDKDAKQPSSTSVDSTSTGTPSGSNSSSSDKTLTTPTTPVDTTRKDRKPEDK